jgi:hypothetical protein
MPTTIPSQRRETLEKIEAAAIAFANDYGPLPAANRGDAKARSELALRLMGFLEKNGLRIETSK